MKLKFINNISKIFRRDHEDSNLTSSTYNFNDKPTLVSVLSCFNNTNSIRIFSKRTDKLIWSGLLEEDVYKNNLLGNPDKVNKILVSAMIVVNYRLTIIIDD